MEPQNEEIYGNEIVAVKDTTYTVAKRKPEKFGLAGIQTLASDIPLRRSNQLSYNHRQKSWDTFPFLGRFPIRKRPTPPLTPQTMLDACIQNCLRVSTLYGLGGGRTARQFRKWGTVLRGNREMTEKNMIVVLQLIWAVHLIGLSAGDIWYSASFSFHDRKKARFVRGTTIWYKHFF